MLIPTYRWSLLGWAIRTQALSPGKASAVSLQRATNGHHGCQTIWSTGSLCPSMLISSPQRGLTPFRGAKDK